MYVLKIKTKLVRQSLTESYTRNRFISV